MKKQQIPILVWITVIFAVFTLGFFLGRSFDTGPVQVSVAEKTATTPVVTSPNVETYPVNSVCYPLDLNTATKEELMTLPGIGEIYAQRILDYRDAHGGFKKVADLLNVEGIGQKRFEDILDLITLGG